MFSTVLFDRISEGFERGDFKDLSTELQSDGLEQVVFRYSKDPLLKEAALQCHIRSRYKQKFGVILERFPGWLFPPGVALQQASHHHTARFKATLAAEYSCIVDLTGGLGMDSIAFSDRHDSVIYLERNEVVFRYNYHNFRRYIPHVRPVHTDGVDWLKRFADLLGGALLYADPARRDSAGSRALHPSDYVPDPKILADLARTKSLPLWLKVSPMADLAELSRYLGRASRVYLLAVRNELKEILLLYEQKCCTPTVETWLCGTKDIKLVEFEGLVIQPQEVEICHTPLRYIYLPHPALIKTRADVLVASQSGLRGLHHEARFYTSDLYLEIPGWRLFERVDFASSFSKLKVSEAMITTGKFPDKPEVIRKRHRIPESDSQLLIATKTSSNKNLWILAKKLY